MTDKIQSVNPQRLDESIPILKEYVKDPAIAPLILKMEELVKDPDNVLLLEQLSDLFNNLGIIQGAVLTYSPYLVVLLSNNLIDDYSIPSKNKN